MGSKSRRRSSASSPAQDIDDNEQEDDFQPSPLPSRPRRGHKPTTKQAQLDLDKESMLESKLKAYEKKYKKLKDKNAREAAERQKKRADHGDHSEDPSSGSSSPGPESEDEPEDVVKARRHQSSFESRGKYDSHPPLKRLRRANEGRQTTSPTPAAVSGKSQEALSVSNPRPQDILPEPLPPAPREVRDSTGDTAGLSRHQVDEHLQDFSAGTPPPESSRYALVPVSHSQPYPSDIDAQTSPPYQERPRLRSSPPRSLSPAPHSTMGSSPPRSRTGSSSPHSHMYSSGRSSRASSSHMSAARTRSSPPRPHTHSSSRSYPHEHDSSQPPSPPRSHGIHSRQHSPPLHAHTTHLPRSRAHLSPTRYEQQSSRPHPHGRSRTGSSPSQGRSSERSRGHGSGQQVVAATSGRSRQSAPRGSLPAEPPFLNGSAPTGKGKAGDYEHHVNKMIVLACHRYGVFIATDDPFPDEEAQDMWAVRAWAEICGGAQIQYKCTDRIQKIITARGSQARGTLRDKIRPLIASAYGFTTDGSERAKLKNLERYTYLLDRDSVAREPVFHYKDVNARTGFAHHAVVIAAIRNEWFAEPTSPGIKYMTEFAPIREVTLALIFTVIEYCLDQWADGTFNKNLVFSEKLYKSKYQDHLKQVRDWCAADPEACRIVRQRLYDRARRASGAAPPAAPAAGLAAASRDRLRLELAAQAAAADDEDD